MTIRKRITFILIWFFLLLIFLGSHYQFCRNRLQACWIPSPSQPKLLSTITEFPSPEQILLPLHVIPSLRS